ncbi:MAG TPA: hypothetical protein VN436_15700, partial [Holophaga sp.]|nr:hypothetical protein [Holophaga sp.]
MKRRRFVLIAVSVLIVAFAGLSMSAEKFQLRVSGQPCLHGLPTWQAIEEKWMKDSPIDMKYMLFAS